MKYLVIYCYSTGSVVELGANQSSVLPDKPTKHDDIRYSKLTGIYGIYYSFHHLCEL